MSQATERITDANILNSEVICYGHAFLADVNPTDRSCRTSKVVLEVSSSAAHTIYPMVSIYGASKAAFTIFMCHVVSEYKGTGLRVHSFNPGSVLTDAVKNVDLDENSTL